MSGEQIVYDVARDRLECAAEEPPRASAQARDGRAVPRMSPEGRREDRAEKMSGAPRGLSAESLTKAYRQRRVVDGLSFFVKPGEVVGLLGPNGAAKSTSFHMIVGLVRPDAGRVLLDGKDLAPLPMHRRARAGLGYLPQDVSVFRRLSVRDNLLAVLEFVDGLSRAERNARASLLIAEFDLEAVEDTPGERLSGGERRRVEIARCLATAPSIVLLDGPSRASIRSRSPICRRASQVSRAAPAS